MRKFTLKTKLIILGLLVLSLFLIFTSNVANKYTKKHGDKVIEREGEMITNKEVKYLLETINIENEEEDLKDSEDSEDPKDSVSLGENSDFLLFDDLSYIISAIKDKYEINIEDIFEKLTFEVKGEKANKAVLVREFLELYEKTITLLPSETIEIEEKDFFIVGIPDKYKGDTDKNTMSTNLGNIDFDDSLNYGQFYANGELILENNLDKNNHYKNNESKVQKDNSENENNQGYKDRDNGQEENKYNKFKINDLINQKVRGLVIDDQLIYIKEVLDEETILHNVWITEGSGQAVSSFVHEVTKNFTTKSNLSEDIHGLVGDLIIQNGEIIGIRVKPDRIDGKVLITDKEYIEIEGYGQIPLDENYKIYKIYGELAQELTNSILVGYETTDFIVAEGKIVAALIKEEIKAENIRVLLKTNQFSDYYHNEVSFTSKSEFSVTSGEETLTHPAGTVITVKNGDDILSEGRLTVKTSSENGKIQLLSIERSNGNPEYRGHMEIAPSENGLLVVNEVPLEEYLYAVIPSEMPSSYGIEALKSQAICARSYAYNHLLDNSLKEYGAHVDDSVSYQVYNNIEENEETILAVKDTYGKVMTYEDLVINAYYFSTSSGHTASVGEVWTGDAQYLTGKIQMVRSEEGVEVSATDSEIDFSNEESFREFILNSSKPTYDSEFAWYRWKTTLNYNELTNNINSKIAARYSANPEYIQTQVSNEAGEQVFESKPIEGIGTLQDVQIMTREKSGILTEIKLTGSDRTVKVVGEYNIRTLLSSGNQTIVRKDGSEVSQAMLPSAFFVVDKIESGLVANGGGYGHGVGMSQYGANGMAKNGSDFEEILKHYYTGIKISEI